MPTANDDSMLRGRSVWVLAAAIAVVVVALGVAIAPGGEETVASSQPTAPAPPQSVAPTSAAPEASTGTVDPTTPPPPPTTTTPPIATTTSAPPPTAPPRAGTVDPTTTASTATPTSTTTTTTTVPTTTTTTPPARAKAGPTMSSVAGDHERLRVALVEARARWDAQPDLSQGYLFRTERLCFCPLADNEITVGPDGKVVEQRNHDGEMERDPPTIADLFDALQAAVDRDAAAISVSFDQDRGFPVEMFIDPDRQIADDESGRSIEWLVSASS